MINVQKLLKDCPKGTKLYSPLFGEVEFKYITGSNFGIVVEDSVECSRSFDKYGRYFTVYNNAECLLFPSKECRTWENFKLTKFKFKVGDWIVRNDGSSYVPIQVYAIKNDRYLVTNMLGSKGEGMVTCQDECRLWTIQDAKDGDVLVSRTDNPFIYNGNIEFSCAGAYVGVSRDGKIMLDMFPSKSWTSIKDVKPATKEQYDLLFAKIKEAGYQWDCEKKELRKIISPKFQIGKWIAYNENRTSLPPKQIIGITGNRYIVSGNCAYDFKTLEADWHLWTIADAKNGDILYSPCCKLLWIYKDNNSCYVGNNLNYNKDSMVINSPICIPIDVVPAAKEQCDVLFQKMEENGYEWIADKKELRKIKSHYDIANFKPFDKVLVRSRNDEPWRIAFYGYYNKETNHPYFIGTHWTRQCVPFEGNEHLLGTTDMCDEQYINW